MDKRLGMVATKWKDSRILQTISTVMKSGADVVARRVGSTVINVSCPNDIIEYQKHMGGVDKGDQHRTMGAGFANVSHFKKWYKKAFMGLADFSLLQAFSAWNLSVDEMKEKNRGGEVKREKLIKWQFYAAAAEEFMTYIDQDEVTRATMTFDTANEHQPRAIPKDFWKKHPHCIICSMEEAVKNKVICLAKKKRGRRMFAKRRGHLALCSCLECLISAHTTPQEGTKIGALPYFKGMSCFQIAHSIEAKDLFTVIERKDYKYLRAKPTHFICEDLKEQYDMEPTLLQTSASSAGQKRGRPSKPNKQHNADLSSVSSSDDSQSTTTDASVTLQEGIAYQIRTRQQTEKAMQRKPVQRPKKRARKAVIDRTRRSSRLRNKK